MPAFSQKTSISSETGENINITIDVYDRDKGILVIRVYEHLKPHNRYLLRIEYNGRVNHVPYGLFRTDYELPGRGIKK